MHTLFHIFLCGVGAVYMLPATVWAQDSVPNFGFADDPAFAVTTTIATTTNTSTVLSSTDTAALILEQQAATDKDLTQPEELDKKAAFFTLFERRPVTEPGIFNAMAFWVQESVRQGVPANTIFLILLTPVLALLVSFVRVVVGLPTLDMLVPIALSFAFVAVGVTVGLLVLGAILIASYISKRSLADLRIMFYPKRSLSMLFLALAVFAVLSLGVLIGADRILSVSIFPILFLLLIGDMFVTIQLHKSARETLLITGTTIGVSIVGYLLATSDMVQNTLILYPELVFLSIPLNILVGRYFGLRFTEMWRFKAVDA